MKEPGPMPTVVCRLSVGEAKVSDTGSWICELSNAAGKSTSTCNVKVVDAVSDTPPCFEQLLSNVTVAEFSDAVLKCKAVGKPEPDVKWFKNEVPIDPSFRHDMKLDPEGFQTLTISDVKAADKGIYKVKVSNTAGWASCDAKLYIRNKAEDAVSHIERKVSEYSLVDTIRGRRADQNMLSEADILLNAMCDSSALKKFIIKWKLDDKSLGFPVHLRNKCQVEGSQAVLTCLVNGIPPFKVRWYKGNKEIFDGPKYFIRGNLNILNLEIPIVELDDTDHYMCVVRNDQGKIFTSCYLQIEPRLENLSTEVPIKPFFTKPMKKQRVNEGDLVVFRVAAKALPAPGFKWFKDGQELHENARVNIETLPNGTAQLAIHMATVRDTGLYVCEAHNHAGRARSMVRLSVRDNYEAAQEAAKKPIEDTTVSTRGASETVAQQNGDIAHKEPPHEPRVESEAYSRAPVLNAALPKTIVIRDRGRFIMECSASGFPRPKVKWMKNDQVLQEDEHLHFLSMDHWYGLEVLDALPRDEGVYKVTLENSSGSLTSSCKIEMKLPREEPKYFHTKEEELEGIFHRPVLQLLQTEFPWHQFDIPGITPSFHLCNYEVDRTENISREPICLVDTLETPQFTKSLPDFVTPYEQDTDLRLECEIGGKPCPQVIWFKDGTQLKDSDSLSITWDSETRLAALIFKSVKLEDSGKYSCIAYSDIGGHAVSSSVLQVRGLDYPDKEKETSKRTIPEFKIQLADKKAVPGEEVRLEVKAEGFPLPEVTWFKNSEPITATTDKFSITSSIEGVHALVIPDIHISDSDCFKCEAKNEYGVVTTCAHVKVLEHSDADSSDKIRPYFEEPLHSISVPLGQDAVFKCIAKGNPMPAFKWLRQGVTSIDQDRVKVEVSEGKTTLTLKNVNHYDAGLYYCFANNNDGTVKSCASLTVLGKDDTAAKTIDVKASDRSEKKDHTLYEEKDFNDIPAEEKKSDGAVDTTDNVPDKSEGESPVKPEPDHLPPKEIVPSIEDSHESVDVKELKLEAETVEDIGAVTEDSVEKSDSDKSSEQKSETEKPVATAEKSQDSGQIPDLDKPSEKKTKVGEPIEEKLQQENAEPEELKKQSQSSEKSATDIIEPNAKTKTETEKLENIKDKTDSEESVPKEKESDIQSDNTIPEAVSKAQAKVLADSEKADSSENTLKEIEDIDSEKINENKDISLGIQETEKSNEGNIPVMKSANVSDSNKSQTTRVPRFISHPRSQWVALNSPLELIFTAEKCEDLTVAWYKDGEILKDDHFQMIWE